MARPQANGQVEVANKTIKYTLKAKLDDKKGNRVDDLPEVLWAYRTTLRTYTDETPFSLAYECEDNETYNQEDNETLMRSSMDLVEEHRSKVQLRVAFYQ